MNQPRSPPFAPGSLESSVGHLGEVLAALDALFRGLRLVLGRHEDMVGVVFGVGLLVLGGGVVGFLDRGVRHRVLGDLAEQGLHQRLVAQIAEPLGELRRFRELVRLRLLHDELLVDEKVDHIGLARLALELARNAGADILQRELQIVVGDLDAIDLGENLRLRRDAKRARENGAQAEGQTNGFGRGVMIVARIPEGI